MTPKSIVTVVCSDSTAPNALAYACSLAQAADAHLDVLALAVDRTHPGFNYADLGAAVLQTGLEEARAASAKLAEDTEAVLDKTGVRYTVQPCVAMPGTLGTALSRRIRFNDLAVLPLPYGKDLGETFIEVVEGALFEAGLPVIAVPPGMTEWSSPRRILLGWNESPEALRAARSALPYLAEADTTYITVIDPPRHGPDRSDPGGMLSQMLSRHGVRCEVDVLAKSLPSVGDVLLRQLSDRAADMLVMGAYGRTRWSEAMFGGATRQMLEEAKVPVLLAH